MPTPTQAAGAAALTDATGAKVGVVGGPLQACGSTAYIVDKVGGRCGTERGGAPACGWLPCGTGVLA